MTNTKKLNLTTALVLSLGLGLAGCGTDDGDDPTTPAGADVTSNADSTPTGADTATDDSTDDDDDDDISGDDDADDTTDDDDDDDDDTTGDDDDASASAGAPGDANAAALAAIATAEAETGGVAYEIDDQDDDGTWEVDVRVDETSVEVSVSADGTTVVGTEEDDDLDDEDRAGLDAATITLQDAIELAISEVGGVLDDAELAGEDDGNQHHWEISVDADSSDDIEVLISVTGEVLGTDN